MPTVADLNEPGHHVQWCPGCGDFGILLALKQAISSLGLEPHKVVVSSGIGCSGKTPHYVKTYGFESLHGRSLPPASAVRFCNPELTVIAVGGDGDGYGIGMGHFIHAMRRNVDITYIVHDNEIYGLTTGQASPTSPKGLATRSTPFGKIEEPMNPLALALSAGATFVARGFAGDANHLTELIKAGITHKGFAFIDVLQPCVTYMNLFDYFRQNTYKLTPENHDAGDIDKAFDKALEWGKTGKVPIGLFYQRQSPTYEEELVQVKGPLYRQDISNVDIEPILEEFA